MNKEASASSDHTISPGIIFMGTPEFAVASLHELIKAGYAIVAVVTAPDKPAGRGMKMNESAVKKYAQEKGLRILQPEKLKNPQFLDELRSLNATLQVVVAFRMLPKEVWDMPSLGTVNLHGSLLPQYRGAAPINWVIINGEPETGVTTFKLQQEIDTGDILLAEKMSIDENETAGELHDRMKITGARILERTIKGLLEGTLQSVPQPIVAAELLKTAPKIHTETCRIDWTRNTADVHNLIRGLSPFPGAFTHLDDKQLKIFRSEREEKAPAIPAGQFETDRKSFFRFACADGYIRLLEIQLEGKKKMPIADFLRGFRN